MSEIYQKNSRGFTGLSVNPGNPWLLFHYFRDDEGLQPPFTAMTSPVMYPASPDARNRAERATSSGSANRRSGTIEAVRFSTSGSFQKAALKSVLTIPGAIALTLMPYGASSRASCRVSMIIPAFEME